MTAKERIEAWGYEDVIVFESPSYDSALIGVSHDNRAVYNYNRMVEYLMEKDGLSHDDAVEFIEYNTIGAIAAGGRLPIVVYDVE